MTRALVLSEHDMTKWQDLYSQGDASASAPYGIDALERDGFELTWARRSDDPLWRKPRAVVEHRTGIPLERAIRGIHSAHRADIVIALLEQQGYAPALAKRLRVPPYSKRPLVLWTCWLADDLETSSVPHRTKLLHRVASAELLTYFGSRGGEVFSEMGIPKHKLCQLPWGVADDFFIPVNQERDIQVLAVGQDRGRDYSTLMNAVRGLDLVVDLVCKPQNIEGLSVPSNVRVHGPVSMSTYRDMMRRAQIMAVPTRELVYPTGSSVALEAAASGCAVVVSATRGLLEMFDDGVNGRTVPVHDEGGWRDVLMDLAHDPAQRTRLGDAARSRVEKSNNSDLMWRRFADVLRERHLA